MVGIHGGMKLSKYKHVPCPTCNGLKSKNAATCMNCFRVGLASGFHKAKGISPRYDKKLILSLKERFVELEMEYQSRRSKT